MPVKSNPLCAATATISTSTKSRALVGYEDEAKTKEQKAAREKALKEGKLAPEIFDKSFAETPKAFYLQSEKNSTPCLAAIEELGKICDEKFGDAAPILRQAEGCGRRKCVTSVHGLLQKKRETEPDPVEEAPLPKPRRAEAATPRAAAGRRRRRWAAADSRSRSADSRPPNPKINGRPSPASSAAAAVLRKRDPFSPAPYLMLRGMRWGELRGSSDPLVLEAPPTEYRQQIKTLAAAGRWAELLNAAEAHDGACRAAAPGSTCSGSWWTPASALGRGV